jgi:NitT/TauT family transport system substrate-binding protein
MSQTSQPGFTGLGKLASFVIVCTLLGLGAYLFTRPGGPAPAGPGNVPSVGALGRTGEKASAESSGATDLADLGVVETLTRVPTLDPAAAYLSRDNTIDLELSEYAGYAGLIAANAGLEPNPESYFTKKHGFNVRIKLSEEESWSALNSGKMAASATTVDVLAVYGRQFQVAVPAQIAFSRGADGLVVDRGIRRVNNLKGKTLITGQFTEAEFFLRFLAQEAGLRVHPLPDATSQPDPEAINLVFAADAFEAGDIYLKQLQSAEEGRDGPLAGAITWDPKTTEVADASSGKAHVLTTNKNLLIIADILIVNKPFAEANPKIVAGLVDGLLHGNRLVRDQPEAQLPVITKAFGWDAAQARKELAKVHFSNLPENQAFFSGEIDMAGSFGGIYQSAVLAYGKELIPEPAPAERFLSLAHLKAIEVGGEYKSQTLAIAPIKASGGAGVSIENDPLLSKDIRFHFEPNSAKLDQSDATNLERLGDIKRLLQVSPGSTLLLRGHVDDALVTEFRNQGGESYVRQQALRAMKLSQDRAEEIKKHLIEKHGLDAARIDVIGRGWEEPAGKDSNANRRVEVQWFTLE